MSSTCNQLDLQTHGSQPIMPKNLPHHCMDLRSKLNDCLWKIPVELAHKRRVAQRHLHRSWYAVLYMQLLFLLGPLYLISMWFGEDQRANVIEDTLLREIEHNWGWGFVALK